MSMNSLSTVEAVLKTKNQLVRGDANGKNSLMGNGDVFIMSPTVAEMAKQDAKVKFNEQVEEARAEWNAKIDEQERHAKMMDENPFQKMKVTESGLILPEYTGTFKNPDSGEMDQEENLSVQALVIEASPLCKFVKEGDIIYYRRACGVPIPFFGQGFEVVAEPQVQVVVNSGLKDRYTKEFKSDNA